MQHTVVAPRAHTLFPRILRPEELPDRYGLSVAGTCCEPAFKDGSLIEVSRSERARERDFIVLFLDPERIPAGVPQVQLKRLVLGVPQSYWVDPSIWAARSNIAPVVLVETLNPVRTLSFNPAILLGYNKVIGPLDPRRARRQGGGQ